MKIFLPCIFTLLFSYSLVYSQKTIALIYEQPETSLPVTKMVMDSLYPALKKFSGTDYMVYQWHDSILSFKPQLSTSVEEKIATDVMYYKLNLVENYQPELKIDKKEGQITAVYFYLNPRIIISSKVVDPVTNTIKQSTIWEINETPAVTFESQDIKPANIFHIPNYATLFSPGIEFLKQNNTAQYNRIVANLHKDHQTRFRKYYESKLERAVDAFERFQGEFVSGELMACTDVVIENEKAKKLMMPVPSSGVFPDNMLIRVFSLDTVKGYVISDLHGYYWVEDIKSSTVTFDAGMYAKSKETCEAWLRGEKIYVSFNDGGYSKKLINDQPSITIGVNNGIGVGRLESTLSRFNNIVLIDLAFTSLIDQLRERYKQEKFMDGNYTPAHIGARYLLQLRDGKGAILDVKTGEILTLYDLDKGAEGFVDEAMDLFNLEMEILQILNGDETKIKKMKLYSPFGFNGNEYFNIYEMTTELVNGKEHPRPVLIGNCQGRILNWTNVEDFVVTKGEKELADALNRGADVRFRLREFKFLGRSFY